MRVVGLTQLVNIRLEFPRGEYKRPGERGTVVAPALLLGLLALLGHQEEQFEAPAATARSGSNVIISFGSLLSDLMCKGRAQLYARSDVL